MQIDLIDMQSRADGDFRFICHVVDHFPKFNIIYPQKRKTAEETAKNLAFRVFSYFGLPQILHSDNGSEFVNDVIKSLLVLWPGKSVLINGSPRHSQSQGLVEQGNKTIQTMTSAREKQENTMRWSEWLPEIQCKITVFFRF